MLNFRTLEFLKSKMQNIKNSLSNFQLPISNFQQAGFTIVEVLVVALILGVIGYMMSDIVIRSLQGSQKTAIIGTAKQNGQVALDSIAQVIRNSDMVVCIGSIVPAATGSTPGDTIVFYSQDGKYIRFRYLNKKLIQDLPAVNFLINSDATQLQVCDTTKVAEQSPTILTDTESTNGVDICKVDSDPVCIGTTKAGNNIFSVTKSPGSRDTVTIQFSIKPSNTSTNFENQLGGSGVVQFRQTIQL